MKIKKRWRKDSVAFAPVEIYIGGRLKSIRKLSGMSQKELGNKLGVQFQQIQKYETGANRIALSIAIKICEIFEMSLGEFVGKYDRKTSQNLLDTLEDKQTQKIAKTFAGLAEEHREKLLADAKWFAEYQKNMTDY